MSAAARRIRAWTLKRQLDATMDYARALHLTIGVAYGMGGWPPAGAADRLTHAVSEAERLTLEWRAAL